jgi:penicillin amidase
MLKKLIYLLAGVVLLLVLLCTAGYYYFVKLPLPETDGAIQIKGLHAPVKVLRDRWGVPHIYAENQHDLFMFCTGPGPPLANGEQQAFGGWAIK